MGTLRLVLKQMRQRALGTWLTLLSVLLGVALAISVLLMADAGQALFGQTEYGYDVIVGAGRGSTTALVMNTVYHLGSSSGNLPYYVYEELNTHRRRERGDKGFDFHRHVKLAVPTAVGDSYEGRRIVGTLPKMFISLRPLQSQLENVLQQQTKLKSDISDARSEGKALPADAAQRQLALVGAVDAIKELVIQTDRTVVPLTDVRAGPDEKSKFRYGDPVYPRCDAAAAEMRSAAESLKASKLSDAAAHQDKAYNLLDDVLASVSANTGPLEYRPEKTFEFAEGRAFYPWKFEAVIGSEVAAHTNLKLGSTFQATHGMPSPGVTPDIHPELWKVVGVMAPTHTAADRCLYIPLLSFYCIAEHEKGLKNQSQARSGQAIRDDEDKTPKYHTVSGSALLPDLPDTKDFINVDVPPDQWEVSAIIVRARGGVLGEELIYFIQNGGISDTQAVNPAQVMQEFFDTFLKPSAVVFLLVSLLVSIVAGVGILVSIYNSVSARTREIAILRALGATKARILTLICAEAVLIGLCGGLLGLLVGHGLGGIASIRLNTMMGQGFNWVTVRLDEWFYLGIVVLIALLAGMVPALKAYRTPVATNLVAE